MAHPWFLATGVPRVIAHRGFVPQPGTGMVENSLEAIAAAHAAGASYIESDCRITRDGVVVLMHDSDLNRILGDPARVADLSQPELAERMQPVGGLLTLEDAVNGFPTIRFNFDVKVKDAAVPVGRVIAAHANRVLLTSFSDRRRRAAIAAATATGPGVQSATSAGMATVARILLHLRTRNTAAVGRILRSVDALQIPERHGAVPVLSRRLIEVAHQFGVEVHVWTVNNPDDMRRLVAAGVDGIVTDRVEDALRVLAPDPSAF